MYLANLPHLVYQASDLQAHHTTALNKGNEASRSRVASSLAGQAASQLLGWCCRPRSTWRRALGPRQPAALCCWLTCRALQYIVENYHQLPDVVLFTHADRWAAPAVLSCSHPLCAGSQAVLSWSEGLLHSFTNGQLHACRSGWHLVDKVRIIRTLQWRRHGFANLRHANMVRSGLLLLVQPGCRTGWPLAWSQVLRPAGVPGGLELPPAVPGLALERELAAPA